MEKEILFLAKNSNYFIQEWIYKKYYKIFIKYIYKLIKEKFISLDLEVDDFKNFIYESLKSVCQNTELLNFKQLIGFVKRRIYFMLINLLRKNLNNSNVILSNALKVEFQETDKEIIENDNENHHIINKLFINEILDFLKGNDIQLYEILKLLYEGYTPQEIAKIINIKIDNVYYFIKKAKQICKNNFTF